MKILMLVTMVALSGCRAAHLGKDTGTAFRNAFEAQARDKSAEAPAALDAEDAKNVTTAHRRLPKDDTAENEPSPFKK